MDCITWNQARTLGLGDPFMFWYDSNYRLCIILVPVCVCVFFKAPKVLGLITQIHYKARGYLHFTLRILTTCNYHPIG